MMTMRRLGALKARVVNAPASMQSALVIELGVALGRRRRERGPSKLARRLRRRQQHGRPGTY